MAAQRSCAAPTSTSSPADCSPPRSPTRWGCFDEEHDVPPPPDAREVLGVRYASQLLGVVDENGRVAIRRRREVSHASGRAERHDVVIHLDRVSADEVATEARQLGFVVEPHLHVPQSEQYLGSTVAVLKRPPGPGTRA